MGILQDVQNFAHQYAIFGTIREDELAVCLRYGKAIEVHRKRSDIGRERLDELMKDEARVVSENGGLLHCLVSKDITLPSGYHRNIFGAPLHPDRYNKSLSKGTYFTVPFVHEIVRYQRAYANIKIDSVSIPLEGNSGQNVSIGSGAGFEIKDAYLYFTGIRNPEITIPNEIQQEILDNCMGKPIHTYDAAKLMDIKTKILEGISQKAKAWGIEFKTFGFTDIQITTNYRMVGGNGGPKSALVIPPIRR